MSARHTIAMHKTIRVARVSAQLGRERAGLYQPLDVIAHDALALINGADEARRLITAGQSAEPAFCKCRAVARRYAARIVERGDVSGMVVGIRFAGVTYSNGADHVLTLS